MEEVKEKVAATEPGLKLRWTLAVPPYQDDEAKNCIDPAYYFLRPYSHSPVHRRKLFRKEILASVVSVLTDVVSCGARVLFGAEQGADIAACLSKPLVVEAACRARLMTAQEMHRIRSSWSAVVGIVAISPLVMPQQVTWEEFLEAVPEFAFEQPAGQLFSVIAGTTKHTRVEFLNGMVKTMGVAPRTWET